MRRCFFWAAGLALAAACTRPPGTATVEGRVTWEGRGVAGALVQAYDRPELDPSVPPAAEGPSGEDGRYLLDLPPGRYWVWARASVVRGGTERRLAGESPANPVELSPGGRVTADVPLEDPAALPSSAGPPGTGVLGRVAGAPPSEVVVYAYPGERVRPTGPGFLAAVSPGADGAFRLDLPQGMYTLAARWRRSGAAQGALSPGDRVAEAVVRVEAGRYAPAGTLVLRPVNENTWRTVHRASPPGDTWIEGVVVDAQAQPQAGIRVLAFRDPRMAGRPDAVSAPTGPDGRFRVYLPSPGTYYLGARSRIGGPAEPGEKTGAYRGPEGRGVRVMRGDRVEGVTIIVEELW